MGLGSLGSVQRSRPRRQAQALALGATIPSACWDKVGFKDCHARMWSSARDACEGGLAAKDYDGSVARCIDIEANDRSYYGCTLRICPPPPKPSPTSSGGWVWKSATPNASIQAFQVTLNRALKIEGYKPISTDGKLGPATCGAFKVVGGIHPELFVKHPVLNLVICQSWTNPTKVGETKPVVDKVTPEAAALDRDFAALAWMQPDARVAGLQQQVNTQLVGHDMRPIPVTGRLDGTMCGAMRWLDQNTGSNWIATWGALCQEFVGPSKAAAAVVATKPQAAPPPPPPSSVVTAELAPAEESAGKSSSNALLAGGLAVLVVAGGLWAKHKGFFG